MDTPTKPRRWPAMGLWAFFTAVTAYTLLADVLRGAEAFTPGHLLAVAALVAALAAGHYAWPELRSGRLPAGILLALVAGAATAYVVISAAARNAETAHTKAARIEASNTAREAETRQLRAAEVMLAEALRRISVECASGDGPKCKGARATEHVYRAAIDGHKARLDRMAPALPPNGGYVHAARFLAALPGITASTEAIEQRLATTLPVLVVLISELAAIVFGIMAFRSQNRTATVRDSRTVAITERPEPFTTEEIDDLKRLVEPDKKPDVRPRRTVQHRGRSNTIATSARPAELSGQSAPRCPDSPADLSKVRSVSVRTYHQPGLDREQAEADLVTMLALGQSVPSQESLSVRWNRPKQTVSDWLRAWESDGLIPARRQIGRQKSLALKSD